MDDTYRATSQPSTCYQLEAHFSEGFDYFGEMDTSLAAQLGLDVWESVMNMSFFKCALISNRQSPYSTGVHISIAIHIIFSSEY
jgi:hypothetical protein